MKQIPGFLTKHWVRVEDFLGTNATGEVFGQPYLVRCMFVEANKQVRNAMGEQVGSSSSYITTPDHRPRENSRVTVLHTGRTGRVMTFGVHTWPGMSVPANTEVFLD